MAANESSLTQFGDVLQEAIAIPFYLVGWLGGVVVRAVDFCRVAVVLGYQDGRGVDDDR